MQPKHKLTNFSFLTFKYIPIYSSSFSYSLLFLNLSLFYPFSQRKYFSELKADPVIDFIWDLSHQYYLLLWIPYLRMSSLTSFFPS